MQSYLLHRRKYHSFTNIKSVSLDGINEDIHLQNGYFDAQSDGTISIWAHPTSLATNNKTLFCCSIGTATSDNVSIFISTAGVVTILGRTGGVNRYLGTATTTTITINNWWNIIHSKTGTTHRIMINGTNQTVSFSVSGNLDVWFDNVAAAGTTLYTIGNLRRDSNANFFAGYLDEPVFFNVGLSEAEMTEVYELYLNNKPITKHSRVANIVSAYRHGDGAGDIYPTSEDYIGTNDGTMENMTAANFVNFAP